MIYETERGQKVTLENLSIRIMRVVILYTYSLSYSSYYEDNDIITYIVYIWYLMSNRLKKRFVGLLFLKSEALNLSVRDNLDEWSR